MECVNCLKTFDFMNAIRLQCGCAYCIKCLGNSLFDVRQVNASLLQGSVQCKTREHGIDSYIIFGIYSKIDNEFRNRVVSCNDDKLA